MYTIKKRKMKGSILIGYLCEDHGYTAFRTAEQIISDFGEGFEDVENAALDYLDSKTRLTGKGCDLSELPAEPRKLGEILRIKAAEIRKGKEIWSGEAIREYFVTSFGNIKNRRQQHFEIMSYISGEDKNVLLLHGLRQTGKTVLLWQAAYETGCRYGFSKTAVYSLNPDVSMYDLIDSILELWKQGVQYFFFDELTRIKSFQCMYSFFGDILAANGCRVVLTGADSGILQLIAYDGLYDKSAIVETSYIGYKESCRLSGNQIHILEYLKSGGILPMGTLYDPEAVRKYMKTALLDNFENSIPFSRRLISEFYSMDFRDGLNAAAYGYAVEDVLEVTTNAYFRITADGHEKKRTRNTPEKPDFSDCVILEEDALSYVKSRFWQFREGDITTLSGFLDQEMFFDAATEVVNNKTSFIGICVYPGIARAQLESLMRGVYFRRFMDERLVSIFLETVRPDVEEKLLKNEILLEETQRFYKTNSRHWKFPSCSASFSEVFKYRSGPKEYDLAEVIENHIFLYEITGSDKVLPQKQAQQLVDPDLENDIKEYVSSCRPNPCAIQERAVLYLGERCEVNFHGYPITYLNIEDFLLR